MGASGVTSTGMPIKRAAMAAYGYQADVLVSFELDHLISLELGWPEPWADRGLRHVDAALGAEAKEKIENALHAAVCAHRMNLRDAQQRIATNWRRALE